MHGPVEPGEVQIEPFALEAYDDIRALWEACEGIGLSRADSLENIRGYLQRNPGFSFVATSGDRIVGAVLCGHDGRRGYLHHLAVRHEFRGRQTARRLVAACLSALREAGIRKCHAFLFTDNIEGQAFWGRIGWTRRTDLGVVSKDMGADASVEIC